MSVLEQFEQTSSAADTAKVPEQRALITHTLRGVLHSQKTHVVLDAKVVDTSKHRIPMLAPQAARRQMGKPMQRSVDASSKAKPLSAWEAVLIMRYVVARANYLVVAPRQTRARVQKHK